MSKKKEYARERDVGFFALVLIFFMFSLVYISFEYYVPQGHWECVEWENVIDGYSCGNSIYYFPEGINPRPSEVPSMTCNAYNDCDYCKMINPHEICTKEQFVREI